jgi:predicted tellurium resistance membrane protein TerC
MLEHLFTLMMLVILQAVLGFDNLLYISLESKRAPEAERKRVRSLGIGIAIGLRIVLLFVLMHLIEALKSPWLKLSWTGVLEGELTFHSLTVLFGGGFILYTALKEITHMIALDDLEEGLEERSSSSANGVIAQIVLMNLVFSFDSILSAMALTKNFWIMSIAIIISGGLMIWLAEQVSTFLQKNRLYEVLGLFILLIVGVMLLSEGGHLSHLTLFGHEVHAMSKATFYFVIAVLVLIDIVQSRYQKKLFAQQALRRAHAKESQSREAQAQEPPSA